MAKPKEIVDIRASIMDKMVKEGRTLQWLSKETGINYNTLHSCLRRQLFTLSKENLDKINNALISDFKFEEKI